MDTGQANATPKGPLPPTPKCSLTLHPTDLSFKSAFPFMFSQHIPCDQKSAAILKPVKSLPLFTLKSLILQMKKSEADTDEGTYSSLGFSCCTRSPDPRLSVASMNVILLTPGSRLCFSVEITPFSETETCLPI